LEGSQRTNCAGLAAAGVVCISLAAGCAEGVGSGFGTWSWRSPELLYILAQPCESLYVEVDTIEGVEPPPESLAALKRVLRTCCDKPGGIRLVLGKPIPLAQARGKPPPLLALTNIDGPPPEAPPGRTAYLYVLYYDSRRLGLPQVSNPYVDRFYPCAIYMDMAYRPGIARHLWARITAHELGHVLGLCRWGNHGDGIHCRDPDCLMAARFALPLQTWLLGMAPPAGLQADFCPHCRRQLQELRTRRPDPNLHFSGPVLVREEGGYRVGLLPACVRLSFRRDGALRWERMRAQVRSAVRRHAGRLMRDEGLLYLRDAPASLRGKERLVARAAADPNPIVSQIATDLLRRLRAGAGEPAGGISAPAVAGRPVGAWSVQAARVVPAGLTQPRPKAKPSAPRRRSLRPPDTPEAEIPPPGPGPGRLCPGTPGGSAAPSAARRIRSRPGACPLPPACGAGRHRPAGG